MASWSSCASLHPACWEAKNELEDWFSQALATGGKKGHTLTILTVWIIWNRRNAIVFRGERKTAQALLAEIKDVAQQWSMAGCKALNSLMVVDVVSK